MQACMQQHVSAALSCETLPWHALADQPHIPPELICTPLVDTVRPALVQVHQEDKVVPEH